jgi:hypothetical protein
MQTALSVNTIQPYYFPFVRDNAGYLAIASVV